MPRQNRLYKGVPLGSNRVNGRLLKQNEIDPAEQVECPNCGSTNLDDLAFSRQLGHFQDVCVAICVCRECGETACYIWAEDKGGV
jgi:hypothetical protein